RVDHPARRRAGGGGAPGGVAGGAVGGRRLPVDDPERRPAGRHGDGPDRGAADRSDPRIPEGGGPELAGHQRRPRRLHRPSALVLTPTSQPGRVPISNVASSSRTTSAARPAPARTATPVGT